jgi:hypothetical protein
MRWSLVKMDTSRISLAVTYALIAKRRSSIYKALVAALLVANLIERRRPLIKNSLDSLLILLIPLIFTSLHLGRFLLCGLLCVLLENRDRTILNRLIIIC